MTQYGPPVACFWIDPTGTIRRYLRRYHHDEGSIEYTCAGGWHEARVEIDSIERPFTALHHVPGDPWDPDETAGDLHDHADPRWPRTCSSCSYEFTDADHWQRFPERVYRAADGRWTGHLGLRGDGPPAGAMWDSWWLPDGWKIDGISLTVQLPDGGYWTVDGPSSSCPMKSEAAGWHDNRTGHRCWTRTGDPQAQPPTVDVNPSIASGKPETYHGWLRHGQLVSV